MGMDRGIVGEGSGKGGSGRENRSIRILTLCM